MNMLSNKNKTDEDRKREQEERMNGFVEDLENIVAELYEVQNRLDSGNLGKSVA